MHSVTWECKETQTPPEERSGPPEFCSCESDYLWFVVIQLNGMFMETGNNMVDDEEARDAAVTQTGAGRGGGRSLMNREILSRTLRRTRSFIHPRRDLWLPFVLLQMEH
ncbi:hypothetical protein NHX12_004370 [Muraenolepis orangiensis]|uniref:Uncharacterized protein n=1 Tax=Muraenolepis orangiensis TaxID=630683 RepID=A0A9Q0DUB0_9TELE|nr:hypothetical protein NHX12_004370 [Muraenolepis orangiensis]